MKLAVRHESWPLAGTFTIARGSRTQAEVVVVELAAGGMVGRGECVPYARYNETLSGVIAAIRSVEGALAEGLDRHGLQEALPNGAARNALDDALWDLEAKRTGRTIADLVGLPPLQPVTTAYTLSLDTPEKMGAAARQHAHRPLLKIKLNGQGDLERLAAIREHAPESALIVDANEGWTPDQVEPFSEALQAYRVAMIEQPLPAVDDAVLADLVHPIPLCADESAHTSAELAELAPKYDLVNIKLDKTGGLTEALVMKAEAERLGLGIMIGCMVGTSLAMAPAVVLAQGARFVDLDGPLWMAQDRQPGLRYEGSLLYPPERELWG